MVVTSLALGKHDENRLPIC